jgi:hypothetical protein
MYIDPRSAPAEYYLLVPDGNGYLSVSAADVSGAQHAHPANTALTASAVVDWVTQQRGATPTAPIGKSSRMVGAAEALALQSPSHCAVVTRRGQVKAVLRVASDRQSDWGTSADDASLTLDTLLKQTPPQPLGLLQPAQQEPERRAARTSRRAAKTAPSPTAPPRVGGAPPPTDEAGDLATTVGEDAAPAIPSPQAPPAPHSPTPASGYEARHDEAPDRVSLCMDVAAPNQVQLNDPFRLAVLIRQVTSPALAVSDLAHVDTETVRVDWAASQRFIRLRVDVSVPEEQCKISGPHSQQFTLHRGEDSPTLRFTLTPKQVGQIEITVMLYQEQDVVGSAWILPEVHNELVGHVQTLVTSITLDQTGGTDVVKLLDTIDQSFNKDELKEVCFRLRVDFDNLPGETKRAQARELIQHFMRLNNLPALLAACRAERPGAFA